MGDCAEDLIEGRVDFYTGEWLDGDSPGYPRTLGRDGIPRSLHSKLTPSEKKIRSVRIELAKLIKLKLKECKTDSEKNVAVNSARQEINLKYGKGWRERGLTSNSPNQWTEEELAPFSKRKHSKNGKG